MGRSQGLTARGGASAQWFLDRESLAQTVEQIRCG